MKIINTHTTYEDPSNLFTEKEQIKQCCEAVSVDICADAGKVEPFWAKGDDEDWQKTVELLKAKYAGTGFTGNIVVKSEGPKQACGKEYTTWKTDRNCCDEAIPLEWDESIAPAVVVDNSDFYVGVFEGSPPYTFTAASSGLYFLLGSKKVTSITTSSRIVKMHAEDVCGMVYVRVTDKCTTVKGAIKAEDGKWEQLFINPLSYPCISTFDCVDGASVRECIATNAEYMQVQQFHYNGYQTSTYHWKNGTDPSWAEMHEVCNLDIINNCERGLEYSHIPSCLPLEDGYQETSCVDFFCTLSPTFPVASYRDLFVCNSGMPCLISNVIYKWVC